MLRLLILAVVVLGLAPGTWLRTPTGVRGDPAEIRITPIASQPGISGRMTLTGTWELTSEHSWVGGFSALVASGPDSLIAGSDRGFLLDLDISDDVPRAVPGSFRFAGRPAGGRQEVVDLEALARDPDSGTLWAAFEAFNLVERYAPTGKRAHRQPPAMAEWGVNSGPETLERLADGRFLMLAEQSPEDDAPDRPALLFPGDPLEAGPARGGKPLAFRFDSGEDYAPVDATSLPDGRVLILLRRVTLALPPRFDTAIMIADPRSIRAGQAWRGEVIQRLSGPLYGDNFEGIAFVSATPGSERGAIWLIADDNFSAFQRSLLVRFDWQG